jgi:hypothetical protein
MPVAVPVAVAPMAPVAPRAPSTTQTAPSSAGLQFNSSSDMLVSPRHQAARQQRRSSGLRRLVMAAFVFLLLGGAAGGVIYFVRGILPDDGDDEEQQKLNRTLGNFAWKAPSGWRVDKDAAKLRQAMHVNLAMIRRNPRTSMGLYYRDYKTRAPGDSELLDVALRKLRGYFPRVEYEDPLQQENKGRSADLGGESAIVMDFAGNDANEVRMAGKCFMLTRQGYAYWLFVWGSEEHADQLEVRCDTLRAGFQLLNEREGWKPQPRRTKEFAGDKIPYAIHYATDLWKKATDATEYDPKAELVLRGFEPVEGEEPGNIKRREEYAGKAGEVQVLVLDRADNLAAGATAALEYIRKRHAEVNTEVKIEPVKDQKGKPLVSTSVGKLRGRVSKLRVQLGDNNEKYCVLAVVNHAAGLLVIYCECAWDQRSDQVPGYWNEEFKDLLATVHLKGEREG